jgi:DNA repair protein RecO (recombination protein O)
MARSVEGEESLILRAIAYGESDRVVTLLARNEGKVSALAKGARRSQRRFAGGLGLLSLGEASFVERPGAELARLERFEARAMWPGILADLGKIAHAGYAAELLDALLPPRQAEPRVFELALAFVHALDAGSASAELLRVFELHLLERIGLRPALEACVRCGRPADDLAGQRLDPQRGGVVCARCHGEGPLLDGEARLALRAAQAAALTAPPPMPPRAARGARAATQAILELHVGRQMKSVAFIDKLNQAAP